MKAVQTGLPGIGREHGQVDMLADFKDLGHKETLFDVEAYKRKQRNKPLEGQINMAEKEDK